MKELLELLSEFKIRKGFDKYLSNALIYFNISHESELNENIAKEIVKFINSSSSPISKSYYILRTQLTSIEYESIIKERAKKFVNSSYKNSLRTNSAKRNNSYFCRGYSGNVNINGIIYYVRSSHEFIYLHYLIKKSPSSIFSTEERVYYVDDYSYKPDFFEYIDNKLVSIYEVKDDIKKFNDPKYINFEKYCESINIKFIKLYDGKYIINSNPDIKEKLESWKISLTEENARRDFSRNNPMLGVKQKESTKQLIREKAIERCNDENYRKMISENTKLFMQNNPEHKKKLSKIAKERHIAALLIKDIEDPFVEKKCVTCGDIFLLRTSEINNKSTCKKNGCELRFRLSNGLIRKTASSESLFKVYKERILNYYKLIQDEENIKLCELDLSAIIELVCKYKQLKKIPEKFGMSSKTVINKYFNDLDSFKNELSKI